MFIKYARELDKGDMDESNGDEAYDKAILCNDSIEFVGCVDDVDEHPWDVHSCSAGDIGNDMLEGECADNGVQWKGGVQRGRE